eukprot:TRINITY_DN33891_c0_g1_i1.p1 TRINITY_DN33891_c0_g1~~TRINITY_DN33891_c0_g1_i1.p1  ORF type:complete len:480 (-),score=64.01 TRINITY_DN33891_c0_g1_i1:490-1929(-)
MLWLACIMDASPQQLRARVLRKRARGKGLAFLDVLLPEAEPREAVFVLSGGDELSVDDVTSIKATVHTGDAVSVTGCWRRPPGDRDDVGFYLQKLEMVEAHAEVHGVSTHFCWQRPDYGPDDLRCRITASVVLQCSGPQVHRLAEYCREVYPGTTCGVAAPQNRSPDRALLVQPSPEMTATTFVRDLARDVNVHGVLRRAFILEPVACLTLADALARLLVLVEANGPDCICRVQVYPRYLEQQVVQEFQRAACPLHLVSFTHVASLTWVGAMYAVGTAPREALVAEDSQGLGILCAAQPKTPTVSRAYAKLAEALARSGWAVEVAALDPGPGLAVDIGASPGGWSVCLASVWHCQEVWAIDPGQLAPDVTGIDCVRHLAVRWQDGLADLRAAARPVDVLVCDANMSCDQTLDMLEAVAPMLSPRAYVVLTFKNTCKTKHEFHELKCQQVTRLRALCTEVREVQLLANRNETTMMARHEG